MVLWVWERWQLNGCGAIAFSGLRISSCVRKLAPRTVMAQIVLDCVISVPVSSRYDIVWRPSATIKSAPAFDAKEAARWTYKRWHFKDVFSGIWSGTNNNPTTPTTSSSYHHRCSGCKCSCVQCDALHLERPQQAVNQPGTADGMGSALPTTWDAHHVVRSRRCECTAATYFFWLELGVVDIQGLYCAWSLVQTQCFFFFWFEISVYCCAQF